MIFTLIYAMCAGGAAMAAYEILADDPRVVRGRFWSSDAPPLWLAVTAVALLWPMMLSYAVFARLDQNKGE